jgi:Tfp pilus assembly PilM family ATPase
MVYDGLYSEISKFAEAIRKHLMYWQMHINAGGADADDVSKVVIVGGNANIKGLAEYLEGTLEVPVEVGDIWKNIFSYESYIPNIHASVSLEYATAVGAALRSIHRSS